MAIGVNIIDAFRRIFGLGGSGLGGSDSDDETAMSENYVKLIENLLAYEQQSAQAAQDFSALQADKANQFTAQQNKQAMDFSAQQAALDRAFQQASADKAMRFEADQAKINRDWQTQMSNTAYSRAMADMQKAGVNPLLAVTGGQSSTPSVGVASGFSSAGSTASGYSGSGRLGSSSKANAASIVQSIVSMINTQSTNSAKIASSAISAIANLLGSFVPK